MTRIPATHSRFPRATPVFLLLVSISSSSVAREIKFKKKIDPGAVQAQLKSSGFQINYIDCSRDNCTIHMPDSEKKDPLLIVKKYVYVDLFEARRQRLATMRSLYEKWKANTITAAEKDDLLKMMVQQVLGE